MILHQNSNPSSGVNASRLHREPQTTKNSQKTGHTSTAAVNRICLRTSVRESFRGGRPAFVLRREADAKITGGQRLRLGRPGHIIGSRSGFATQPA